MFKVEEIKNKIATGGWTREDTQKAIDELKILSDLTVCTEEIYAVSYGIFSYNFREYAYPMIEICRETGIHLDASQAKARIYLALVRLYFCLGFPPKIVEYGLKYANSGYTMRSPLKSVYNTIVAAFTDCGLFSEADIYLEKMMDISRKTPCSQDVDFWDSDILNELVYYDSKVYVKIGLGDIEGARQATQKTEEILSTRDIPEDGRNFFLLQKEFTDMYLRLYQQEDKSLIAGEFNDYMKKMEAGEGARDTLSFCVRYFGEFLQVMAEEERWEDIVRIGTYIQSAKNFSGSFCPVYKVMRTAASKSSRDEIRKQAPEFEKMYINALEHEMENYDQMVRMLAKEELRIVQLRESLKKDTLTGCLNRNAFEKNSARFIHNHQDGCLVFIDLDYLKLINDSYGHENGDRYLIHFVNHLSGFMDERDRLYRYAGDEFLILSAAGTEETEKRLKNALETNPIYFPVNGGKHHISFSYGIVAFREEAREIEELVKEADRRMYQCKKENHRRIFERGETK